MPKKINIGDVFGIETAKGVAYLHFIYQSESKRQLVRVLPGFHNIHSALSEEDVCQPELYLLWFPVSAAYNKNLITKVGFVSADGYNLPASMRTTHVVGRQMLGWNIVDTATWKVRFTPQLDAEDLKLSDWETWNDTLLIERLEEGWTLDKWI